MVEDPNALRDPRIKSGYNAEIEIILYRKPAAITVPKSALFTDHEGRSMVYVVTPAGREKRTVVPGPENDARVEIIEGLKIAEKVLLVVQKEKKNGNVQIP